MLERTHVHVNGLESSCPSCQACNITVPNLVHPKSHSDYHEEDRQLNRDGEDEDAAVCTAHSQRRPDPLEGLPSEQLYLNLQLLSPVI